MALSDDDIEQLARREVYDGPIPANLDTMQPTQEDYIRLGKRVIDLKRERAREESP